MFRWRHQPDRCPQRHQREHAAHRTRRAVLGLTFAKCATQSGGVFSGTNHRVLAPRSFRIGQRVDFLEDNYVIILSPIRQMADAQNLPTLDRRAVGTGCLVGRELAGQLLEVQRGHNSSENRRRGQNPGKLHGRIVPFYGVQTSWSWRVWNSGTFRPGDKSSSNRAGPMPDSRRSPHLRRLARAVDCSLASKKIGLGSSRDSRRCADLAQSKVLDCLVIQFGKRSRSASAERMMGNQVRNAKAVLRSFDLIATPDAGAFTSARVSESGQRVFSARL